MFSCCNKVKTIMVRGQGQFNTFATANNMLVILYKR